MSFTPNLPISTQSLGQTQQAVLDNFAILRSTLAFNHVDVNASGNGKHKYIQMPVVASIPTNPNPPGGLVSGDANIYSKTVRSESNLFFSPDNSGNEYQLTNAVTADFAKFAVLVALGGSKNGGWTFLPGGLILQYITTSGSGNTTITYPTSFSLGGVANNPYSIFSCNLSTGTFNGIISSITAVDFNLNRGSTGGTFNIFVIGPKT